MVPIWGTRHEVRFPHHNGRQSSLCLYPRLCFPHHDGQQSTMSVSAYCGTALWLQSLNPTITQTGQGDTILRFKNTLINYYYLYHDTDRARRLASPHHHWQPVPSISQVHPCLTRHCTSLNPIITQGKEASQRPPPPTISQVCPRLMRHWRQSPNPIIAQSNRRQGFSEQARYTS